MGKCDESGSQLLADKTCTTGNENFHALTTRLEVVSDQGMPVVV